MKALVCSMLIASALICPQGFTTDYLFYPAEASYFDTTGRDCEKTSRVRYYTAQDAEMLAKLLYHEARGVESDTEKACVVWTVLNRVDAGQGTIAQVVTAEGQFAWYEDAPIDQDLYDLALDVLSCWVREKNGEENIGRVLPSSYLFFFGEDGHNWFYEEFGEYYLWDYSLASPYED